VGKGDHQHCRLAERMSFSTRGAGMLHMIVLVSGGCHNKMSQTGQLITSEIYTLTVLEAGSPKSRCWQSGALSRRHQGGIFPCLFLASGVSWQYLGVS